MYFSRNLYKNSTLIYVTPYNFEKLHSLSACVERKIIQVAILFIFDEY